MSAASSPSAFASPAILFLLLASAPTRPHAAPCDQQYHFRSAYQVMLSGPRADSLRVDSVTRLDATLAAALILHPDTEYRMVTGFTAAGACSDWRRSDIDLAFRKKGDSAFQSLKDTSELVRFATGDYPGDTLPMEYWFGFAAQVDTPRTNILEVIGKQDPSDSVHVWYGNAVMRINRTIDSTVVPLTFRFPKINNHADSASLQDILLKGWRNERTNDTQTVSIRLQLIKVVYDTTVAVSVHRVPGRRAGFLASRPETAMDVRGRRIRKTGRGVSDGLILFLRPQSQ